VEVNLNIKSSANNVRTPVPLHCIDVLDEATGLCLPVNRSPLICTILNLKTVSSREESFDKASCSKSVYRDCLGDGDDANDARSK